MPITWRDKMAIDHDIIDQDHRLLIDLLNTYEEAITNNNTDKLEEAFGGLIEYTHTHFAREEQIQRKIGYIDNVNHAGIHGRLILRMDKFHKELKKTHEVDKEEIGKFFYNWLIGHVMAEDKKMIPFIKAARAKGEI